MDVTVKVGWRVILYRGCRFVVPEQWLSTTDAALMWGPDGSRLSAASVHFPSWSAHKAQMRAAFGRVKVLHEDSDRRLWLEIGDQQRAEHYVDVSTGNGACIAILDVPRGTALTSDDIQRIIDGVGPAPEHWSPGDE